MTQYVGAIRRLQGMPAWFHRRTAAWLMGIPVNSAKTYLNRWSHAGLVTPLGGHTGIYFNRVVEPETSQASWAAALTSLYPEAVVIGDSILNATGLTTQIPSKLNIAVLTRRTFKQVDGVALHPQPKAWFRAVHEHLIPPADGELGAGIRELPAVFALADLLVRGEAPDDDDVAWEDVDAEALEQACRVLGVPVPGVATRGSGQDGHTVPAARPESGGPNL